MKLSEFVKVLLFLRARRLPPPTLLKVKQEADFPNTDSVYRPGPA